MGVPDKGKDETRIISLYHKYLINFNFDSTIINNQFIKEIVTGTQH